MPITGDEFAEFAEFLADNQGHLAKANPDLAANVTAINALDPLPAVLRCAKEAGAIDQAEATRLSGLVRTERFSALVGRIDPLVLTPAEMLAVPRGAFIAFIQVKPLTYPGPLRPGMAPEGMRHLIHVMVSLGKGIAAGTKGGNIGLPVSQKWEKVDLAKNLNWNLFPGTYDAISESLGIGSPRHLRIRYRSLEELFKEGRIKTPSPQNLVSPLTIQEYNDAFASGWWFWNGQENVLDEGWKLHVSCNAKNADEILNLVLPKLREGNFAHKFLLTRKEVADQDNDPEQAGKVIAIYPQNIFEAFDAVAVVDNALIGGQPNRAASPVITNEIHVGNTVVYTRYGPYKMNKWILNQAGTGYDPDPKGQTHPAWIPNAWGNYPNQTALNNFPAWPKHTLAYPFESKKDWARRLR